MKKVVVFVAIIVVQCAYGSWQNNWTFTTEMVPQETITQELLNVLVTQEAPFRANAQSYWAQDHAFDKEEERGQAFIKDWKQAITLPLFQGKAPLRISIVTKVFRYGDDSKERGYAIIDDHTSLDVAQVRYLSEMNTDMFQSLVDGLKKQFPSQLITVTKPSGWNEFDKDLREIPSELASRLQLPLFNPCGGCYKSNNRKWEYRTLSQHDLAYIYRFIAPLSLLEKEKQLQEELDAKIKALREQHQTSLQELRVAACACIAALPACTETLPLATPCSSSFATPSSSRALSPVSGDSDSDNSDSESNDSQGPEGDDRESFAMHDRLGVHADGTVSFGLPGDAGYKRFRGRMPIVRDGWFDACVIS